ncbi:MAG TPA: type II toxin-antitoxin system VapC family toxin [Terracidiphilus sp.]|jgi:predicted nucleic acid-binding protein|nr:type II toxin-antitoxin system VapC family toxin [Terracidiphilus sp.]
MILADTSVWVDHFRSGDDELRKQLINQHILMHPFIVAELALGSLPQRAKTLSFLEQLPSLTVARLDEVRKLIEVRSLYTRGIGLIDTHLIASVFLNPSTVLWTRDKRLSDIAKTLGIHANLP